MHLSNGYLQAELYPSNPVRIRLQMPDSYSQCTRPASFLLTESESLYSMAHADDDNAAKRTLQCCDQPKQDVAPEMTTAYPLHLVL